MADNKYKDYVPPRLNTASRFAEMTKKADAATKPATPSKAPDETESRISAKTKAMDSMSVEALLRRAKAAEGK